ncbi:cupin domain-containing protein [Pseudonocardia abyssalis]|uniref:Cupin domain-containing protein n=1 Tax=Pseudonocardia abyssalis TaxID=2792008 RepID=A0ABS6UT90_9PSEU|nr:cupin domain-containing protein [Pseudonocardia abyssalis]MBW0119221.1 cupin domain-containing protein [Pseudonocardia abyssalis]MBW0135176.1 cupin domain-containing protein [Pseudonocardia abyssalis]
MPLVRHADARRTTTPNATMTTHASPTQGATTRLAVWTVEMAPAAAGPLHAFDVEQVWTVLDGRATAHVGDTDHDLGPGDTLVVPAGVQRRIHAVEPFRAVVAAPAGARATPVDGEPVLPPWIA